MAREYEAKVLDIDPGKIENKLMKLMACREPEVLMRRWVFDIDPSKQEWIRLRTSGKKATITYKTMQGQGISDTEEIEVGVDDFDRAYEILAKLRFKGSFYQESKRILFKYRDLEFSIDSWPRIPPFLEVEAGSEKRVLEGLAMLGLRGRQCGNPSVAQVFEKYGLNLHSFKQLKF